MPRCEDHHSSSEGGGGPPGPPHGPDGEGRAANQTIVPFSQELSRATRTQCRAHETTNMTALLTALFPRRDSVM